MRIAFDHQAFSRQKYGGISRYFHQLVKSLSKDTRNRTNIFAPYYINKYIYDLSSEFVLGEFNNNHPPVIKPALRWVNTFIGRSQMANWQPDVIHETYYSPIRTGPVGVPSVLTVYDMTHELFPEQFFFWDRTITNKKKALERVDHIICISYSTRNDLLRLYNVSPQKVSVIYLAYENKRQFPANLSSSRLNSNGRPFILFVGQRNGYKNFTRLLKAFAGLSKISRQFDLVCFGGSSFTANEMNLIENLGLKGSVTQLGGNDEALSNLYATASCLVYPSLYEGFGLPLLEAMGHDCPVVCSNISSLPEVSGDAAELFDPLDESSIGRSLQYVLLSPNRQDNLILKGRQRLSFFSWDKCAKQTLQVYAEISQKK